MNLPPYLTPEAINEILTTPAPSSPRDAAPLLLERAAVQLRLGREEDAALSLLAAQQALALDAHEKRPDDLHVALLMDMTPMARARLLSAFVALREAHAEEEGADWTAAEERAARDACEVCGIPPVPADDLALAVAAQRARLLSVLPQPVVDAAEGAGKARGVPMQVILAEALGLDPKEDFIP